MHRLNPRKLLLSKWTAAQPRNREKHFLVTQLHLNENDEVIAVELEAVYSKRSQRLDWQALRNADQWLTGWR
ncbi:TIGR02450 family Trp-rich protein [Pseudomonas sp. MS19]|uniref:TIGR02450 family Trp-rich protein n=1 Tax=Pseudomonas sp. MS19 TaxID=2579939 RepID=UPI0015623BF7|nr:TIGR02450 family Trp-rich protein [Pseudomonas sp. MS19]NRH28378.1 TIGR02450 family Trp-rich protein [Pseudomonas sp. MS19]